MGVIVEFFKGLVGRNPQPVSGTPAAVSSDSAFNRFYLTEIALFTAVDWIARALSKCEFVTVRNDKEIRGAEYFAWNYKPNRHQTKAEFITEFVSKLIFRNEVLIIESSDGQLLIADSFARQEFAVRDDIFSGVTARGYTFQRTFLSSEVIYLRFDNIGVANLLVNMCSMYQQLMQDAAEKYEQASGHKVILGINTNPRDDTESNKQLNNLFENEFKKFFSKKNAVLPLYKNFSYNEPTTDAKNKNVSEVNDLERLKAEAFKTVGNALHISPAVLTGDASMLSDAMDASIGNAVDPIAHMLAQAITIARYGEAEFLNGSYLMIDTTYARHIDAINSAANIDKAIACGTLNPFKAQKYCNMLPCSEDWAKEYYITKNYQNAEIALKGGENE